MTSHWDTPIERFYAKIIYPADGTGCWVWAGGRKKAGYGQFSVNGQKVIAHRWSYKNFTGKIPDGHEVDHLCRNKSCVNPRHLEAITLEENRRRRNESKTECVNGHLYTEQSTYWWIDRSGYRCRRCRICNAASANRRHRATRSDERRKPNRL